MTERLVDKLIKQNLSKRSILPHMLPTICTPIKKAMNKQSSILPTIYFCCVWGGCCVSHTILSLSHYKQMRQMSICKNYILFNNGFIITIIVANALSWFLNNYNSSSIIVECLVYIYTRFVV
jgi:hypothetical protein